MRISEMRRREDFSAVLVATLSAGWTQQYGERFSLGEEGSGGQPWRERFPFDAFVSGRVGAECRRYLRDSFQFTPVRWRIPAQYLLGGLCASWPGGILCARSGFGVNPAVPDQSRKIVAPGNMRVRVFDFTAKTVRVFLKTGFSRVGFRTEIEVRGNGAQGPFPPILANDIARGWFEEPIIDGFALPRCPPWVRKDRATAEALEALDLWSQSTLSTEGAEERAAKLADAILANATVIDQRFPTKNPYLEARIVGALVSLSARFGKIETVVGHGDFQPGNILVPRGEGGVLITDFEHSARRFRHYDRLVLGLGSRSPLGLGRRMLAFVNGVTPEALESVPRDLGWRVSAAAMLILEDLLWYSDECLSGPFSVPSRGYELYCDEVPGVVEVLERTMS